MTTTVDDLITQLPHLKDPLEFYARWQRFRSDTDILPTRSRALLTQAESRAYPPDSVASVLSRFGAVFGLTPEDLAPLALALENGAIDFMRLPLGELPAVSLSPALGDPAAALFLLARPWFLKMGADSGLNGREWAGGRCPLCSARPAFSSIAEGPSRRLHCSWCGTTGPYRFIGCPNCGNEVAARLGTLMPEKETGFRVATCDACQTYVKVAESRILNDMTVDLADLASLPLDIVAGEKGYARKAPTPIGLTSIA